MACAGYTRRQVKPRSHCLPGLSHLPVVFNPTQVDRRTACRQAGTKSFRKRSQYVETVFSSDAPSARDQPLRFANIECLWIAGIRRSTLTFPGASDTVCVVMESWSAESDRGLTGSATPGFMVRRRLRGWPTSQDVNATAVCHPGDFEFVARHRLYQEAVWEISVAQLCGHLGPRPRPFAVAAINKIFGRSSCDTWTRAFKYDSVENSASSSCSARWIGSRTVAKSLRREAVCCWALSRSISTRDLRDAASFLRVGKQLKSYPLQFAPGCLSQDKYQGLGLRLGLDLWVLSIYADVRHISRFSDRTLSQDRERSQSDMAVIYY